MLLHTQQNVVASQLTSIQKLFSSSFSVDEMKDDALPDVPLPMKNEGVESSEQAADGLSQELVAYQSSVFIDLSSCMQDTEVTLPTLNG